MRGVADLGGIGHIAAPTMGDGEKEAAEKSREVVLFFRGF